MYRYRFTEKSVKNAKNYIKNKKGPQPSFLKKFTGTVKNGELYLENKLVIKVDKIDSVLRKIVLQGTVPLTRDGLYYYLAKKYVGITRSKIDKFLKSQDFIRQTDRMQPTTKKASRKVNKKGQIGFDLIEINWKDLGHVPTEAKQYMRKVKRGDGDYDPRDPHGKKKAQLPKTAAYIFSAVDKLTGLMFCEFSPTKERKNITPIAKKMFGYFSKQLNVPMNKLVGLSDSGAEFDFEKYKTWGIRLRQLKREPLIEKKNSQFQAALYRVKKMNLSKSLKDTIDRALKIVNRTKSKQLKIAPFEAVSVANRELSEKYNKRRGKGSGVKVRARPLQVGEYVRLNTIGPKKDSFYKAYKGKQWSKVRYKVIAKKGNRYKINGPKGFKFYHRDDLRITPESDKKSNLILTKRKRKK